GAGGAGRGGVVVRRGPLDVREVDLAVQGQDEPAMPQLLVEPDDLVAHARPSGSATGRRKRTVVPAGEDSRLNPVVSSRMITVPRPLPATSDGGRNLPSSRTETSNVRLAPSSISTTTVPAPP